MLGTDNSSSLEARVNGAKEFGAHLFVSLHINAFGTDAAHGIEVHVTDSESSGYDMGSYILAGLAATTELNNRGMKYSPDLYVLKNSNIPAALVEMGFISNADDAALLDSRPDLFAKGVYDGILAYVESLCESEAVDQTNNNN